MGSKESLQAKKESMPVHIENGGNTDTVTTEHGKFSYLYNIHEQVDPNPPPQDVEAIALETFGDRWTEHPVDTVQHFAGDSMYSDAFSQQRAPILLMTPYLRGGAASKMRGDYEKLMFGLGVGTITVACLRGANRWKWFRRLRNRFRSSERQIPDTSPVNSDAATSKIRKYSRRAFLGTLSAWAMLPYAAGQSRIAATSSGSGYAPSSALSSASRIVHPEIEHYFPDHKLFAALMIHKMEWLMRDQKMKHIACIVGTDHQAELTDPDLYDKKNRLELFVEKKDFLKEAVDKDSISSIVSIHCVNDDGTAMKGVDNQWKEPELDELMKYVTTGTAHIGRHEDLLAAITENKMRNGR